MIRRVVLPLIPSLLAACGTVSDPGNDTPDSGGEADAAPGAPDAGVDATETPPPPSCDLTKPFSTPVPVPGVNDDTKDDFDAWLTPDEKHIYFISNRGTKGNEIWMSARADRDATFSTAILQASTVTEATGIQLSNDEKRIYYHARRGSTLWDLYRMERADLAQPFSGETKLGGDVNTDRYEQHPYPNASDTAVYFVADRAGVGQYGIYRAERTGASYDAGKIQVAATAVSPWVSDDELTLFYSDGVKVQKATRGRVTDPWSPGEEQGALRSTKAGEQTWVEWVSPDGCRIYLTREPTTSAGNDTQLYVAQRPK